MINKDVKEDLVKFDIFLNSSKQQLNEVEKHIFWRTFKKGQFLFMEGDPRERIYFMLKGYVKLERVNTTGTLLYYDYVKSYSLFPYGGLFTDETYSYSAEAVTDVELFYIPTAIFEDMVKKDCNQLMLIINELSNLLKLHESRVQNINTPNAQDRVIQTINFLMNDLGEKDGQKIVIHCPITTTELSKISATCRETVSGVLKKLKDDEIITINSKKLIIQKPDFFVDQAM